MLPSTGARSMARGGPGSEEEEEGELLIPERQQPPRLIPAAHQTDVALRGCPCTAEGAAARPEERGEHCQLPPGACHHREMEECPGSPCNPEALGPAAFSAEGQPAEIGELGH